MKDFQITVQINSLALSAMFQRLADFGDDQSVVMADLAEGLLARTLDRFDTQTAPNGTPWDDLTARHLARKRRKGYPETLLLMEGRLRNEMRSDFGADFAEVVTAPLPYAAIHQFGGRPYMAPGPAGIPARPYMGVSQDDLAWIEKTLAGYLRELAG